MAVASLQPLFAGFKGLKLTEFKGPAHTGSTQVLSIQPWRLSW